MSQEPGPGDVVGPYRIGAVLGEGGVGVVYLAERDGDGEPVALKVLRADLSRDEIFVRRFAHEARAAAEVHNRHLVPILDAGEDAGRSWLAMAYVPGRTLAERIRDDGRFQIPAVVRLAAEVGGAIDALHAAGIVHRDVKPSNVLIDAAGASYLTDFGLAKGRAYTVLTKAGQVVGTLDYLAPELVRGEEAAPASDVYALGCVMFECIAGASPFAHRSVLQVGMAHLSEAPPDPCASRDDAPAGLSWALLSALAKDPSERPPSGTAYSQLIRAAAAG